MNVHIDKLAERRLWAFIRATKDELGGMGYAYLQEDGSLAWTDTFLIPQEASAGGVDFEATHGDQIAIERADADGVLTDPAFVWCSWHSHHTMEAYWSSTDDKRIAAMNDIGVTRLLSFVGCHDGEYKLRLDVFGVSAHGVDIGQVKIDGLSLVSEADDPFSDAIRDEIKANVKAKSYTTGAWFSTNGTTSLQGDGSRCDYSLANQHSQDEREALAELRAEGWTHTDAEDLLARLGVDGCEQLIDANLKREVEDKCKQ